ncbi:MAG: hypothetical protein K6F01_11735 [Selenomonas sp.]|uniref:hypothetical protein n=1 Tax=Selenomonas sp. TaxID=2053611 RepID=UPI0025FE1D75|nr:hypothetical protein [Selenomonas sp.]MCR5440084.1 hypothetical protein [Selenomonas sp.]
MLKVEEFQDLQEEYTITKKEYLEHRILLDALRGKESNAKTLIRLQNKADVGLELSNDEIADNVQLLKEVLKDTVYQLGYQSPFEVILQLNPKFRIIAVLEMFYKLQIRAIHRVNGDNAFLLLTTHDEIKICDIKNFTMQNAIKALVDRETGSYVVNRINYEKSIKSACLLKHEANRASLGFIFNEHKPTVEEMNFVLDCIDKRSKAEFLAFNSCMQKEKAEPLFDEVTLPFDNVIPIDDEIPDYTPEPPFVPEFEEPTTSTPLDSEDDLPF